MNREQIIETMARGMFDSCPPLRLTGEPIPWDDQKSFTPMNCRADAVAALSALEAVGMAVVPVEPTDAMQDGIWLAAQLQNANAQYAAMIKAALDPERDKLP